MGGSLLFMKMRGDLRAPARCNQGSSIELAADAKRNLFPFAE